MSAIRILVSFKVTPDYEALREGDWAAAGADGLDVRYVRRVLNCFDESALEMALRLADAPADGDGAVELGALTVGGREAEPHLRTLLALGYERATRVQPEAGLDFAPADTAAIIAGHAQRVDGCDLLMLGCRSGPGDTATVPFLVAEMLGWPCLSQVVEVERLPEERLRVAAVVDDGLLRATLRLPCVLAVGNAVVSHLRVPTLTDRLTRKNMPIDVLTAADLGVDAGGERRHISGVLTGLEIVDRARAGVVIGGGTSRDQARRLFDEHLRRLIGDL